VVGNHRRLRPVWLVLAAVVGCLTTACVGGSSEPAEETMSLAPSNHLPAIELWSAQTGWREAPPAAITAPRERWRVPARLDDDGAYATEDGVIAVVARDGDTATVRRIDAASGTDLWRVSLRDVAMPAEVTVSPDGSLVAVASELTTVVMDAADGRVVWRGAAVGGLPRADSLDDLVLVDVSEGTAAVDRGTGAIRWQTPEFVQVFGTSLLVSNTAGFSLLDPATGTPVWTKPRELYSDAHIFGDTFLVTQDEDGSADSTTAYDLATGEPRWQLELFDLARATVAPVDDDTVLIVGGSGLAGNGVAAVTLSTGKVNWQTEGKATVMRVDGQPYVLNERGDGTEVLLGATGEVVGSTPLQGERDRWPLIAGGALYQTDFDKVRAMRIPELAGQWEITLPNRLSRLNMPIPHGFVVADLTGGLAGHLVGYVG
jgi:outer membrane protein assembly factor BamB